MFDSYARPTSVTRSNSLGATRTDVTAYHDNTSKWVLGQVASVTTGSAVAQSTVYDSTTALPEELYAFTRKTATLAYNADGTLLSVTDGNNNATTLASWKRGLPQTITYADSTSSGAVINDLGWITATTNELAATTSYGYDNLGRITSVTYPTGDTVAWTAEGIGYSVLTAAELGMPIGTWRQRTTVGRYRKSVYYDAMWRPVLTEDKDTTTSIAVYTRRGYDYAGRETFTSYPSSSSSSLTSGINTTYDALGRVTNTATTDGITLSTHTYPSGNKVQVTDADGNTTTTTYPAYGQPEYSRATLVEAEEGQTTTINRDVFGNITSVTQAGSYNGSTLSQTRTFTYNSKKQLCRRHDPESGNTRWGYDAAGRVTWEQRGSSTTTCTTTKPSGAISFSYDTRNRKKTEDHSTAADDIGYG